MTCLKSLTGGGADMRMHDWDSFMYEELANEREDEEEVVTVSDLENKPVDDWWNRSDRCPLGGSL